MRVLGALFVAFGVHEAGHLLAGRLAGFRFGLVAVGPVCVARSGDRLCVRWLPPWHWGPFAVAYPLTAEHISTRAAWYAAGGPLASLVFALISAAWMWAMPGTASRLYGTLLTLTSACVFVATAQPFGTGAGVPSDGGRVWALLRGKSAGRSTAALLALDGLDEAGVRPRDWDSVLVQEAAQVNSPPAYALSAATAMLRRAQDTGDAAAARAEIDRIRRVYSQVPRWLRADAAAETAFWLAFFEKDAVAARGFLRDAHGPLVAGHRRLRAQAAVLARSSDLAAAEVALEHASAALGQSLGNASPLDLELIEAVRQELSRRRLTD
jgi:hypothetical protein